jgi:hypothetical protein
MDPKQFASDKLAKGYVLDEQGAWAPLAQRVVVEREFRSHLENGEVLVDGEWTPLSRAVRR